MTRPPLDVSPTRLAGRIPDSPVIPAPLRLPPGRALTDVWPHLSPDLRRRWLRVVQEEATAVRDEAAAQRAGRRPVPVLSPGEAGALWDRERREAAVRGMALDRKL